jgi:hypothetical protein
MQLFVKVTGLGSILVFNKYGLNNELKPFLTFEKYCIIMTTSQDRELRIRNGFKLFNLPVHATKGAIKKRYKELAKIWHPDSGNATNNEEKFKALNDAYSLLIAYKNQNAFSLKPEDYYLKKSEKDLNKESYRKTIKQHLIAFYKSKPLAASSAKQSRKDFWLININFLFSCTLVLVFPPLLTISLGWEGLLLSLFLIVFLSLFIMSAIRNLHRTQLLVSIKRLLHR